MKPIALKELQEAVRVLNHTLGDVCPTTIENAKEDIRIAIARINGAIFSETPSTSTKFDIYKMAAKDETRPVMGGVFHDRGNKVASDGVVLVAVKDAYDEALEGHILDRKGQDIIGKYPRWETVFPREEETGTTHVVHTEKVYEALRIEKAEKKAAGRYGESRMAYVKVGDTFFRADKMAMVCAFMDAYGAKEITTYGPRRAAAVYAPDGSKALIMPVVSCRYIGEDGNKVYKDTPMADVYKEHRGGAIWAEFC